MDVEFRFITELINVDGLSIKRASPIIGIGGTRLDHTIILNILSLSPLEINLSEAKRITIFEIDQKIGAHIINNSAFKGMDETPSETEATPIIIRPIAAIAKPINCLGFMTSLKIIAAKNGVINACNCAIIEARPAGMPISIA